MKEKRSIPLTDKLPLYFIMLGLVALTASGVLSFYSARNAMLNRTFDQLTSVRIEKLKRLKSFFDATASEALRLSRKISHTNDGPIVLNLPQGLKMGSFPIDSLFQSLPDSMGNLFIDIDIASEQYLVYVLPHEKGCQNLYIVDQEEKNNIMLDYNPHNGLGKSGEAYLVDRDSILRSQSRFIPNSALHLKVNTEAVAKALNGETGTEVVLDYRGISVLSAFAPFEIPGKNFAVMAEIDLEEAMIPVYRIRNRIIIISLLISMIVFVVSYLGTRRIIKPIIDLKNAAQKVGEGEFNVELPIVYHDEIGDLTQSFNQMTTRLGEQSQELKAQRHKQLRSMIDGQEYEQQRFSRELHDGLGQALSAIKMQLEGSMALTEEDRDKKTKELLRSIDSTIDEVRRMSNNLQPVLLDNFGLKNALQNLCDEVAKVAPFNLMSGIDEVDFRLGKRSQTYLFRIAQEGLNNIMKHAQASEVGVNFYQHENGLVLSIEDNGTGFDTSNIGKSKGQGLDNMIQRASLINALIDINSVPEKGTIITVTINSTCKEKNGNN